MNKTLNIENILAAKEKQGISLRQLSRETGYSMAYLSNILKGESSPTIEALSKIINVLGLLWNEVLPLADRHTKAYKYELSLYKAKCEKIQAVLDE